MDEIAVLGVGMHPWGKWGRNFTEYGWLRPETPWTTPGSTTPTSASCRAR